MLKPNKMGWGLACCMWLNSIWGVAVDYGDMMIIILWNIIVLLEARLLACFTHLKVAYIVGLMHYLWRWDSTSTYLLTPKCDTNTLLKTGLKIKAPNVVSGSYVVGIVGLMIFLRYWSTLYIMRFVRASGCIIM